MSDNTPRLGLPELAQMQEMDSAQINEALVQIDALVDVCIKGLFVNTPPTSPADGDTYVTGGAPTGVWSGTLYKLAYGIDGGWRFYDPHDGLVAWRADSDSFLVYRGGQWTALGALMAGAEASIASAATCDLGAAGALTVQVTGTTAITSFGTAANKLCLVRFAQALTLTHNAASLVLLGGASRVTAANDVGLYRSDGSGNWRELSYARAAIAPDSYVTLADSQTLSNKTLTAPLVNGATLGGSTAVTGAVAATANGAASTPVLALTGTTFSGGTATTTRPSLLVEPAGTASTTWSTGGTLFGVNGASTFGGNLIDLKFNNASKFSISNSGNITIAPSAAVFWSGRSVMMSPADGVVELTNNAGTGFTRLQFGGTGSGFPALRRSGAALNLRLADDSGDAAFTAAGASFSGAVTPASDNAVNLGSASLRWGTVYAATGSINTSDAAAKANIRGLDAAEMAVAKTLAGQVRLFQFSDALTRKGDGARLHAGMLFQDVTAAFGAQGLDPRRYGIVCEDRRADGSLVLGLRYDELAQFVMAGLCARLAVLEAA